MKDETGLFILHPSSFILVKLPFAAEVNPGGFPGSVPDLAQFACRGGIAFFTLVPRMGTIAGIARVRVIHVCLHILAWHGRLLDLRKKWERAGENGSALENITAPVVGLTIAPASAALGGEKIVRLYVAVSFAPVGGCAGSLCAGQPGARCQE